MNEHTVPILISVSIVILIKIMTLNTAIFSWEELVGVFLGVIIGVYISIPIVKKMLNYYHNRSR